MSTASDFPIDQNVQHKTHTTDIFNTPRKGVGIGNKLSDGDQVVAVEWADGQLSKVNVNDLQKCLSLEEEFAQMQNQVNEKLAEAAKLIREAGKLAGNYGKDLLSNDDENYDRLFEIDCIEGAMDEAGWNTSSWYC